MNAKLAFIKKPIIGEFIISFVTFLFLIPQPYLTIPELDASWQVALEEAFYKGWEFGTTINFTGGPLSLLYTPTSLGYHVFLQIFAESLGPLAVALSHFPILTRPTCLAFNHHFFWDYPLLCNWQGCHLPRFSSSRRVYYTAK